MMLTNHKLLIDQHCPLCQAYGNGFQKMGLIDSKTVNYYQTADEQVFSQIDQRRAKSEVALFNEKTGETIYGVDSFLLILSQNNRFLKLFFKQPWFHGPASKLYRFISFNRHIIAGHSASISARACVPPLHLGYRWAYILITPLFTGLIVNQFSLLLDTKLGLTHQSWREYAICFGQIGWQFLLLTLLRPSKRIDYLGNMSTVSLIGGLLLIPLFTLNFYLDLSWLVFAGGFGMVVMFMFWMHLKRCARLGLPLLVSISWIVYRTIVLIWILVFLI